jgi:hypothetical protein
MREGFLLERSRNGRRTKGEISMQIKTVFRRLLTVSAALLCLFTMSSTNANATLFASICNDLACSGGDDFIVQDNVAPDTIPTIGALNFTVSAFGFTLVVNTSQSKPMIGSRSRLSWI